MPLLHDAHAAHAGATTHEKPVAPSSNAAALDSPADSAHPFNGPAGVDVGDENGAGRAWIYQRPTLGEWAKMYWVDLCALTDCPPTLLPPWRSVKGSKLIEKDPLILTVTMAAIGAVGLGVYFAHPAPTRNFPITFSVRARVPLASDITTELALHVVAFRTAKLSIPRWPIPCARSEPPFIPLTCTRSLTPVVLSQHHPHLGRRPHRLLRPLRRLPPRPDQGALVRGPQHGNLWRSLLAHYGRLLPRYGANGRRVPPGPSKITEAARDDTNRADLRNSVFSSQSSSSGSSVRSRVPIRLTCLSVLLPRF